MMGPDPVVTTSPTPDSPAAYLPQEAGTAMGQEQRPVRQRADPAERGPVGEPPAHLSSLLTPPARGGGGEQRLQQQQYHHQQQQRMMITTHDDTRQVHLSPRAGREQQPQQPQQYAKAGVPGFAGNNTFSGGFGKDQNPLGSTAQYGSGGRDVAPTGGATDTRLPSRNNLLLHLQPLQAGAGSRTTSRGPPTATASSTGQQQRQHQHQHQQQQRRQATPPEQRRWHQPPTHLQQQPQQEHQHQRRDRDRAINPTPPRTNFVHHQAGATPPSNKKTPGEIWLCNSEGRFIAPAGGAAAAAAADAAARDGIPAGSSSPIIAALQAKASPEKVLPVPMAVRFGTPDINPKCLECQDLVRARLDEPVLLREDRHCDAGLFGRGDEDRAAVEEGEGSTRNAVSPWRLRNKTRTGHIGLILCLNIGECRMSLTFCLSRFLPDYLFEVLCNEGVCVGRVLCPDISSSHVSSVVVACPLD